MTSPITKTPSQIRDDFLRTISNGLLDIGVANPDVSETSDYFVLGSALADMAATLDNNIVVQADALLPDTASGSDLDRHLDIYGLTRRAAATSHGQIQIVCSSPTLVPTGSQLVSSTGIRYEVSIGGIFSDGDFIDLTSIDVGAQTNLENGSILTWVSPPFATQSTAEVTDSSGSGAITGGIDAENDEAARQRLLARLQSPPGSGNWQQVAELAESVDPVVQKAFVYPAANGPSTLHIAVTGYPSDVSKSRMVDTAKMDSIVIPTITSNIPEFTEVVVTTVQDVNVDVAIRLTLPLAPSASSSLSGPGPGGGWLDGSPFPVVDPDNLLGSGNIYFCPVATVTNSTTFQVICAVSSSSAPRVNVSRVQWIDRTDWSIKQAKVVSYTTGGSYYTITIDTPFVGIATYDWIFPASVNAQTYLDAILDSFSRLGPGEKTSVAGVLPRAYRKPRPSASYPMSIDTSILKPLIASGDEVFTADFYYRGVATPANQSVTSTVTPVVPSSIIDGPKILIPRQIGFYANNPLV